MIEEMLRNYSSITAIVAASGDEDLRNAKIDLDMAMRKLQSFSDNLYKAIIGVFVWGNPIQEQAKQMNVSKRQINRRLDDGLHFLTMIMNGEVL
jgi:hypothetical protein